MVRQLMIAIVVVAFLGACVRLVAYNGAEVHSAPLGLLLSDGGVKCGSYRSAQYDLLWQLKWLIDNQVV